jgi:hypothetical protein
MRRIRNFAIVIAVVMTSCWLFCASETEAHESADVQPCVTCCVNHQMLPPLAVPTTRFSDVCVGRKIGVVSVLSDQTVIRLLEPPPKFSA